jgi:deoxyribodipyrimidine photo-lyase
MLRRDMDIDRRGRQVAAGRRGDGPVIYLMSRDQRAEDNWALLWAQQEALIREKPLAVVFCLDRHNLGTDPHHAGFMIQGLESLGRRLTDKNIGFTVLQGSGDELLPEFIRQHDAHVLVSDLTPLTSVRDLKTRIQQHISVPFYEVDAHNIIPVWIASNKKEYGAYTIRPKIQRLLPGFLTEIPVLAHHPHGDGTTLACDPTRLLEPFSAGLRKVDDWFEPGEKAARAALEHAINERLPHYTTSRNNPCEEAQSNLSPWLHFGHLSAQRLALRVSESGLDEDTKAEFLEELVVRRELSDNFCHYEPNYARFEGFPDWARKSLNAHRGDVREHCYSLAELEESRTHESLWNSCQRDLVRTGKLHGYLRMYWAKKILEWTAEPEEALEYGITLNDRYSIDGHDPNGYTGIAWSIGGVHDRAWSERPVFGKIRYMNERGCRRKFSVDTYIESVEQF